MVLILIVFINQYKHTYTYMCECIIVANSPDLMKLKLLINTLLFFHFKLAFILSIQQVNLQTHPFSGVNIQFCFRKNSEELESIIAIYVYILHVCPPYIFWFIWSPSSTEKVALRRIQCFIFILFSYFCWIFRSVVSIIQNMMMSNTEWI